MILRQVQMDALQEATRLRNVVDYLYQHHAAALGTMTRAEVRSLAEDAIRRAQAYKFHSASDVTTFVVMTFDVARDFDKHPAIARILTDASIPDSKRMDALLERTSDRVWEEAARMKTGNKAGNS